MVTWKEMINKMKHVNKIMLFCVCERGFLFFWEMMF